MSGDAGAARPAAYGLLARLLINGVDDVARARAATVPWLADAIVGVDADVLAASHHRAFRLEAFPNAGVFLDAEASAGGEATDFMLARYRACGFRPSLDDVGADHLGVALAFLSFADAATWEARRDGRTDVSRRLHTELARFLDGAFCNWVPQLAAALDGAAVAPLWATVTQVAAQLADDHREALVELDPVAHRRVPVPPRTATPLVLGGENTDLRSIATYFSVPAACGMLLTRGELYALGRRLDVPRGFGSRRLVLENLLRSAAEFAVWSRCCEGLSEIVVGRLRRCHPTNDDAWRTRLLAARDALAQMAGASPDPDPGR